MGFTQKCLLTKTPYSAGGGNTSIGNANHGRVLAVVLLGGVMEPIDASIVDVTLPTMGPERWIYYRRSVLVCGQPCSAWYSSESVRSSYPRVSEIS